MSDRLLAATGLVMVGWCLWGLPRWAERHRPRVKPAMLDRYDKWLESTQFRIFRYTMALVGALLVASALTR